MTIQPIFIEYLYRVSSEREPTVYMTSPEKINFISINPHCLGVFEFTREQRLMYLKLLNGYNGNDSELVKKINEILSQN